MSVTLYRRPGTPYWWVDVKAAGKRIRRSAGTTNRALAREFGATIETGLFRAAWHGERRGDRSFAQAIVSYLDAQARAKGDKRRLERILETLGDVPLAAIDQEAVDRVRRAILAADAAPATVRRGVIVPIRAVLLHAHRRGWCDAPHFEIPREAKGRTRFFLPEQAERLLVVAVPHLRVLAVFLIGTGARLAEALELAWPDVDLVGGRAIFWDTKNGERRVAKLPPRVVAELANLPHREGPVFRWETMRRKADDTARRAQAYADRGRQGGGQIKTAWKGALNRAGLDPANGQPGFTPHDCRHTWATWHYAMHKDLLLLKQEGGWSSVTLVERYAHVMPAGHEEAIRHFLGWSTSHTFGTATVPMGASS